MTGWGRRRGRAILHGQVAGDGEAGDPVSADDQLVEIGGLLAGEPVEAQVVQDEKIWRREGAEGPVHRVAHPDYEYLDLGRMWQTLLFVGLLL